jgi:hypothetical protein
MKKTAFVFLILAILINPYISVIFFEIPFFSQHYIHQVFAFIASVLLFLLSICFLLINSRYIAFLDTIKTKIGVGNNRLILIATLILFNLFLIYFVRPKLYIIAFPISNDVLLLFIKYTLYFSVFLTILLLFRNQIFDLISLHVICVTLFLVLSFFSLEILLKLFIYQPQISVIYKGKSFRDYMIPDRNLGEKPKPGIIPNLKTTLKGDTVCNVRYTIDSLNRRITLNNGNENTDNHLILFGESWIFGDGLNDNQTLPSILAINTTHYTVYNYGYIASGPQHTLAKIESGSLQKEIKNKKGIAIFHFNYSTQIERLYGSLRVFGYSKNYVFYDMEKENFPRKGTLLNEQPQFYDLLFQLSETNISKVLHLNFPIITDYQLEQCVKFLKKIEREYLKLFPDNQFYILLYPSNPNQVAFNKRKNKIIQLMNAYQLKILDYSNLFIPGEAYTIKNEGHPNFRANTTLAKALIKDLKLN